MDTADAQFVDGVRAMDLEVLSTSTVMRSVEDRINLASRVLDFAAAIRARQALEAEEK